MPNFSGIQISDAVSSILSGFVAAWIFYSLTSHPKANQFERVIQALIFTAIIRIPVLITKWMLLLIGSSVEIKLKATSLEFGAWTSTVEFVWSMIFAVVVGVLFSTLANTDWLHNHLRRMRITKRTSYPSEWSHEFNRYRSHRYMVLHLAGDKPRRLSGWVAEWPDQPDTGHFVIQNASWHDEEGNEMKLEETVESMLVRASDVEMVEFMKIPAANSSQIPDERRNSKRGKT